MLCSTVINTRPRPPRHFEAYNVYVDSVAGDDSNPGTRAAPLRTLAALQGFAATFGKRVRMGLKRNCTWNEGLIVAVRGATLGAYGTGDAPYVDCGLILTFTKTDGYTNVYQCELTAITVSVTGYQLCVNYEDDTELTGRASLALVDANPGSAYVGNTSIGQHPIIYVHSTDSSDPTTNGHVYKTSAFHGVDLSDAGLTIDCGRIHGIHAAQQYPNDGSLRTGKAGAFNRCIARRGHKHHALIGSGDVSDMWLADTHRDYGNGTPLVVYGVSNSNQQIRIKRLFFIGKPAVDQSFDVATVLYSHYGGSGALDAMYVEQYACVQAYSAGTMACARGVRLRGGFFDDCRGTLGNAPYPIYFDCVGERGTTQSGEFTTYSAGTLRNVCAIKGRTIRNSSGGRLLLIENCAFVQSGISPVKHDNVNAKYNVLIGAPQLHASTGYVGDYNVFADPGPYSNFYSYYNNTLYTTLSAWQTATGQDAHSVWLTDAQLAAFWAGNTANGDFRINPNAQVTAGDGTIYTGTFPDGTPITRAGASHHWDWNTRMKAPGVQTRWPVVPITLSEAEQYMADPSAWNFYP